MNPMTASEKLLATILAGVVLLVIGFFGGKHYQTAVDKAGRLDEQQLVIVKHDQKAAAGAGVEKQTTQHVAQTAAVFNGINQELIKHAQTHPLDGDCSLDDDGLRLWRAANANREPDSAGSGNAEVPGLDPRPGQRQDAGPAGESRAGDEDVPRVQGSPQRPGGLAGGHG